MIPFDRWRDNGDGTALWVLPGLPATDELEARPDPPETLFLNRPCDTCGGKGIGWFEFDGEYGTHSCPDCDGTGRHTFIVEVNREPGECRCTACTGERCWTFHPFGEFCDHDSLDRHAERDCDDGEFSTLTVHVLDVLLIRDWHVIGVNLDFTLPPAAQPGMWLVRLEIHP